MKREPHPARKVREGRFRIITAVSVVDQLVERMLFGRVIDAFKSLFPSGSAMVGIGFSDELASAVAGEVLERSHGLRVVSGDISGWDSSVSQDLMLDMVRVLADVCQSDCGWWREAAELWARLSCNCSYAVHSWLYVKL